MKIIIHRGMQHIDGCVTEIVTKEARLFFDTGSELPDDNGQQSKNGILIEGVTHGEKNADAIFYTRRRGNHLANLRSVIDGVPVYLGDVINARCQKMLREQNRDLISVPEVPGYRFFTATRIVSAPGGITYEQNEKTIIGDVVITPFWVSYSACQDFMFLIEAEGKRILYTGDFRIHGYAQDKLWRITKKFIGKVDLLITGGSRYAKELTYKLPEEGMKRALRDLKQKHQCKFVFVFCSTLDKERISAFRELVPDHHEKKIRGSFAENWDFNDQMTWDDGGAYYLGDHYQQEMQMLSTGFKEIADWPNRYGMQDIAEDVLANMETRGFCMFVRNNPYFRKIIEYYQKQHPEETLIVYSMWEGYLKMKNNPFGQILKAAKHREIINAVGSSPIGTFAEICKITAPQRGILPIYGRETSEIEAVSEISPLLYLEDGQIFEF